LPKFQRAAGDPARPFGFSESFNRKAATLATHLAESDWQKWTKVGRIFVARNVFRAARSFDIKASMSRPALLHSPAISPSRCRSMLS
jgi:hypothetical protein